MEFQWKFHSAMEERKGRRKKKKKKDLFVGSKLNNTTSEVVQL